MKEIEKYIYEVIDKYKDILLMGHFRFRVKHVSEEDNKGAYMSAKFHFPYLLCTICYVEQAKEDLKKDKTYLKNAIIHEMCHALTDPLYGKGHSRYTSEEDLREEREKLTDHISNIIINNKL